MRALTLTLVLSVAALGCLLWAVVNLPLDVVFGTPLRHFVSVGPPLEVKRLQARIGSADLATTWQRIDRFASSNGFASPSGPNAHIPRSWDQYSRRDININVTVQDNEMLVSFFCSKQELEARQILIASFQKQLPNFYSSSM